VPADASLEAQSVRGELPASNTWFSDGRKAAALTLIHRGSAEVVWGDSKADGWSWSAGAKALATKLVAQLKKDYAKGF
jgi:hypothetical protein